MSWVMRVLDAVDAVLNACVSVFTALTRIEGFSVVFIAVTVVVLVALVVGILGALPPPYDPRESYVSLCRECVGGGWTCAICDKPGVWCECDTPDPHDCATCGKGEVTHAPSH